MKRKKRVFSLDSGPNTKITEQKESLSLATVFHGVYQSTECAQDLRPTEGRTDQAAVWGILGAKRTTVRLFRVDPRG
jgi:hypothetical protein